MMYVVHLSGGDPFELRGTYDNSVMSRQAHRKKKNDTEFLLVIEETTSSLVNDFGITLSEKAFQMNHGKQFQRFV